jgi:predicted acyltransferase
MMATVVREAAASAAVSSSTANVPASAGGRLLSLDAFRGFIMITLAANGFALRGLMKVPGWEWLGAQFEHIEWTGVRFWDLIQPAFMFMVGMALPFAIAARRKKGDNDSQIFRHVAWRAFMLILWSQIIMSISRGSLHFQLINVLSQIGFAYFLTYLIFRLPVRAQAVAAAAILAGHWALFVLFPGAEGPFSKADNIGAVIDRALGLHYSGYYVTINFLGSTVTTLLGAWTGKLLMEPGAHDRRMRILAGAALACLASGWMLSFAIPMVKRIWTASFTLFSGGLVLLMLFAFYWLVEVRGYRKAAFPLLVVGANSIFIYTLSIVLSGWLNKAVGVFTFNYSFLGQAGLILQAATVAAVMWYACYWLYQRKIFFKF